MWEQIKGEAKQKETRRFFDWMDEVTAQDQFTRQARDVVYRVESKVPEISGFRTVPQSAPWHAEGPILMHHIERMLAGLFAILDDKTNLLHLEELAREKSLRLELEEMQEIIREQAATLQAFILLHDIAKSETISFDSPANSKGASEGFTKTSRLKADLLSQNYLKLIRSFQASENNLDDLDLAAKFFEQYKISIHYFGHAELAASEKYQPIREVVADIFRLTARDREMLYLLIRYHMDAILFFKPGADATKYSLLKSRALKAHIDADDYLDLQLAAMFLDTAVGTRVFKDGKWQSDLAPTLNMLRSEELTAPERRQRRQNALLERKKKSFKDLLYSTGLSSDVVFEELNVPFGSDRAKLIEELHDLIKNPELAIETEKFSPEMIKKINHARGLYAARQA